MRGADELIAMRRAGYVPSGGVLVYAHAGPMPPWTNTGLDPAETAEIEISADERVDRLDLRCVIGLRVVVTGDDEARVREIAKAVAAAAAQGVIGIEVRPCDGEFFERWICAHNPWTKPEKPWHN